MTQHNPVCLFRNGSFCSKTRPQGGATGKAAPRPGRKPAEDGIFGLTAFKGAAADGKCTDATHPSLFKPPQAHLLRNEAYLAYAALTKDEDNAADGRFPTAA